MNIKKPKKISHKEKINFLFGKFMRYCAKENITPNPANLVDWMEVITKGL